MSGKVFRWCLFVAATCLALDGTFQLVGYVKAAVAVTNSGLEPLLQRSFRALWLGAALQSFVLATVFAVAGWRPAWISRPVVVLCGLLPIASSALFFSLVGSGAGQILAALAALAVLVGAMLWPRPGEAAAPAAAS